MYNAPRVSMLWFLPILMFSVYTWGYFRPTYIRRSNVSYPRDRGVTAFVPSLLCIGDLLSALALCLFLCRGLEFVSFVESLIEIVKIFHTIKAGTQSKWLESQNKLLVYDWLSLYSILIYIWYYSYCSIIYAWYCLCPYICLCLHLYDPRKL